MTIYDIAQQAGVSISTVSRVINHTDTVSLPKRLKVESVLKQLDFHPDPYASYLGKKAKKDPGYQIEVDTIKSRLWPLMLRREAPEHCGKCHLRRFCRKMDVNQICPWLTR